jgi:hypothetical protein
MWISESINDEVYIWCHPIPPTSWHHSHCVPYSSLWCGNGNNGDRCTAVHGSRCRCLTPSVVCEFALFNQAILGRQAWHLVTRVFKGHYSPNVDFLHAVKPRLSSYTYRYILFCLELMWKRSDGDLEIGKVSRSSRIIWYLASYHTLLTPWSTFMRKPPSVLFDTRNNKMWNKYYLSACRGKMIMRACQCT